jgi:hypothetical protein
MICIFAHPLSCAWIDNAGKIKEMPWLFSNFIFDTHHHVFHLWWISCDVGLVDRTCPGDDSDGSIGGVFLFEERIEWYTTFGIMKRKRESLGQLTSTWLSFCAIVGRESLPLVLLYYLIERERGHFFELLSFLGCTLSYSQGVLISSRFGILCPTARSRQFYSDPQMKKVRRGWTFSWDRW